MSNSRIKKKNLNASEIEILLKISDFRSNFQQASSTERGVVNSNQPSTIPAKKRSSVAPKPSPKVESSFGIRAAINEIIKEQSKQQKQEITTAVSPQIINQHNPFDLDAVIACIDKYVDNQNPEQMIVTALKTHQPIIEKEQITIFVDNQLLLDKLEGLKVYLESFLVSKLKNDEIKLNFKLFDIKRSSEKKKLFTSGEKLEHFIRLNPAVAELKKMFSLELE